LRKMRRESPARDAVRVFTEKQSAPAWARMDWRKLHCSLFLSRSRGWTVKQETTPALNPATLSTTEGEMLGPLLLSMGGRARGIVI
jgi:hypothetical protein